MSPDPSGRGEEGEAMQTMTPKERILAAVRRVFDVCGKTGPLITPCSFGKAVFPWANVLAIVDEWKKLR
jgi:hypothetical protein